MDDPDPSNPNKPRGNKPFAFVFRGTVKLQRITANVVSGDILRIDPSTT